MLAGPTQIFLVRLRGPAVILKTGTSINKIVNWWPTIYQISDPFIDGEQYLTIGFKMYGINHIHWPVYISDDKLMINWW